MKKLVLLSGVVIFFVSCASNPPGTFLSDPIIYHLELNEDDDMAFKFSSSLSDKHKTNWLNYSEDGKASATTDITPRKTFINQTFKKMLKSFLKKKFTKLNTEESDNFININLKNFKISKPYSSKSSKIHIVSDWIIDAKLTFEVSLETKSGEIIEKKMVVDKSASYGVKAQKKKVLKVRNQLITDVCNIGVMKVQKLLDENNF